MTEQSDVIVAGGGPVGLMLATELRLAGVSVTVLERRTDIDPTIKAGALNSPTVQALYRRGLLPELQAARDENMRRFGPRPQAAGRPAPRFVGHFAGIMLDADAVDPNDPVLATQGDLGAVSLVSQQQLEAILERRARDIGVDIRRGVTVTGFDDTGDGVTVDTDAGVLRAGWLVGCDGGRSLVRKGAGFDFPGTPPEITAYQAMATMRGAENLARGWHVTDTGVYAHGPHPDRILVAEFGGAPADRTAPVTPAELQAAVRRVTGTEVTVDAIASVTRFTDNARQATTYRRGRVLVAGDAAHVHSPFGGQGLNLGMGDATNLGWKLAATVRGWAPDGLLDTYTAERHPVGAWVLDWTRAQIAIMRPDPHARAIRAVVADLAARTDGATYLATRIAGLWQRYELPGEHPLVGHSAPDLALGDGTRLADHLHDGRALLLDLADDADLRPAADGYADRLTVHTATADDADLRALLVRPDGYVAWAATDEADTGLDKSLRLWLGGPTT
ncbi:MAG TPA: FAD-dependent monooxygenase [Actinocatenispora sp.]